MKLTTTQGQGAEYWDGKGTNGGAFKPHPLLKFKGSGTYSDFTVLNSPAQAVSIGNSDGLTFDGITIDNSAGDEGELGHNTDVSPSSERCNERSTDAYAGLRRLC